ncbi:hypothetical protein IT575_14145 [bacterium]|nr:hypothetical protein [bacterium]
MEVRDIDPIYYAMDKGTGVAIVRGEDTPPREALVDFLKGTPLVRPGAIVPMAWEQLWDYRTGEVEIPGLFRWEAFKEWMAGWPAAEADFRAMWKRHFGMPGNDMADACIIIWEEKHHS